MVRGRVNWREGKMAVFGSDLATLDVSGVELGEEEPPLVLEVDATGADRNSILELRSTLRAHKGATPVRIVVRYRERRTTLAVDDYPVTVTSALLGSCDRYRG